MPHFNCQPAMPSRPRKYKPRIISANYPRILPPHKSYRRLVSHWTQLRPGQGSIYPTPNFHPEGQVSAANRYPSLVSTRSGTGQRCCESSPSVSLSDTRDGRRMCGSGSAPEYGCSGGGCVMGRSTRGGVAQDPLRYRHSAQETRNLTGPRRLK